MEGKLYRPRKPLEPSNTLVPLTIRVHPEARRQLKSAAALEDMSMEERARRIIYGDLGIDDLPVIVNPPSVIAN